MSDQEATQDLRPFVRGIRPTPAIPKPRPKRKRPLTALEQALPKPKPQRKRPTADEQALFHASLSPPAPWAPADALTPAEQQAAADALQRLGQRPGDLSASFIGSDVPTSPAAFLEWINREIATCRRLTDRGSLYRPGGEIRVRNAVKDALTFLWDIRELRPIIPPEKELPDPQKLSAAAAMAILKRFAIQVAGDADVEWSNWDRPSRWYRLLGYENARAFVRAWERKEIPAERRNTKSYRIALSHLRAHLRTDRK